MTELTENSLIMPVMPALNFYFSTQVAEERKELFAAYIKAWGNTPTPKHNKKVKVTKEGRHLYDFWYTDLAGIIEACKKPFAEQGLAVMQNAYTTKNDRGIEEVSVETMFLHISGHWMKTEKMTFVAKTNMQDFGGQVTYMKRYSLSAALGMATEADDDGNGASGNEVTVTDSNAGKGAKNANNGNSGNQAPPPASNSNQPPAGKSTETVTGPPAASPQQLKMVRAKLKNVADAHNMTPEEMYLHIQEEFKVDVPIAELKKAGASSLINILTDAEASGMKPKKK